MPTLGLKYEKISVVRRVSNQLHARTSAVRMETCMSNNSGSGSMKSSQQNHKRPTATTNSVNSSSRNSDHAEEFSKLLEHPAEHYSIESDNELNVHSGVTEDDKRTCSFFSSSNTLSMDACFATFDRDGDGYLNFTEFSGLCRALFRNDQDKPYQVGAKAMKWMLQIFDTNQDGFIDDREFETCWHRWIKKIIRPVSVLVVVDVQNDFITGSLAVSNCPAKQNGEEVVEPINRLLDSVEFECVFYSLDWHPDNHVSFVDNVALRKLHESSEIQNSSDARLYDMVVFEGPPLTRQKLWPRHCVQNSWGAKLHENLKVAEGSPFIYKGTNPDIDSYSAFWDNSKLSQTSLVSEMRNKGVTDVYVCGLAYDVCVGATALHSIEHGYRTILINDACRGINLEDIQSTKANVMKGYGVVVESYEVKSMVLGRDRKPELGYKLALECMKEIDD